MSNKYKKFNQVSRKKQEDNATMRTVMGLVAVAIVALVVFFVYGGNSTKSPTSQAPTAQQEPTAAQLIQRLPDFEKNAQANPNSFDGQRSLPTNNYDVGFAYLQNNQTAEMTAYFGKAVDAYQKALAIKFDINVQTDMATAAFYGNKPDIADAAFKKAIEKQPDFLVARLNYGIFLRDAKKDKAGAKTQFEFVANQTKDVEKAKQAKELLSSVQ